MADPTIPFHDFSSDDESSIDFEVIPLRKRASYDTSVPHRHNYYEIFLFQKGGGLHDIDFAQIPIASHSVHFVSPGQVHKVFRELDTYGLIILFSRDFYHLHHSEKKQLFEIPFLNNAVAEPVLNLTPDDFHRCYELAEKMGSEYKRTAAYQADLIRSYLNIFLIECKRLFGDSQAHIEDSLYTRFRIALEENFTEKHQVQDYSGLLHASDKQLTETVKNATGKTALEAIHERLMLEAKRLLLHSELSNKEIAYFLHFEDPSHFSKFFKAKAGDSPSGFRQHVREPYIST